MHGAQTQKHVKTTGKYKEMENEPLYQVPQAKGLTLHQPLLCIHNGLTAGPTSQWV